MKKQIKILGVLAVALTLGLSACNGGGGKDSSGGKDGSSSRHQHTAAENAPWQHDDSRHWKDCVANDGGKVDNKAHDFEDVSIIKDSTCTEVGSKNVKCKVCGFETTKEIALKDHEYIADPNKTNVEPNCTEQGHTYTVCKNCGLEHDEVLSALGHDWGEWEVTKAAKCEETGSRKHTCSRCNLVEDEVIPALGHKLVTKDTAEPEPGKAAVRVYECQNEGCDVTYFGFKATETSPNSGRLVEETDSETGDVGKRFWGRPIGNDVALDDNGTADRNDHEPVYNPETQGDLFEYVFTLTQEQINVMGDTVACYADAKPADYLGGQDFWAADLSKEEWTPGLYIEGEKAGQQIEDYRYILYVDGHPVEFDHRMTAPVSGSGQNLPRGEFLMPYVFRFTAGEHSISLRMAGGYRSVFYNFIFRPYEVPAEIPVTPANVEIRVEETQQLNCSVEGVTYKSANTSIATVSDTGLVTGVKAGETSITVSKEGNYFPTTIPVKVNEKAGIIKVEAESGTSSKNEESQDLITFRDASGGRRITDAFPKDAVLTITINADAADTYQMTINGRRSYNDGATDMPFTSAFEIKVNDTAVVSETAVNGTSWADYVIANVALNAGANTMTIKALTEVNPINLDYFKFESVSSLPPEPEHTHVYEDTKVDTLVTEGCTTVDVFNCKDGDASVLRWEAKNYDATLSNEIEAVASDGSIRFNRAQGVNGETDKGGHLVYKINSPVALQKAGLSFYIQAHNQNKAIFDAVSGDTGVGKDVDADGKYTVTPTKRYALYVNDARIELGDDPGASTAKAWFDWPVEFPLKAGENKIEIVSLGGYRAKMYNFQLTGFEKYVHVHNFVYGTEAVQKEGECDYKVGECASDHVKALKIDAGADLNKKLTRGGKLPKGSSNKYDGTAIASYKFTAPEGFGSKARLMAIATPDNANNFDYSFYTGKTSSGSTQNPMQDGSTNTVVKINGVAIVMPTATYKQMGCTGINEAGAGLVDFGEFNLAEGTNEFTLAATNSYGLLYWDFIIVAA